MSLKREEIRILCQTNPDAIIALIETYEARISQLEARIAELEARLNQNSNNSSKPPSSDVFVSKKSQRKKGSRPVGGQKGHAGRTLEMVENPDKTISHKVTTCEGCGESLEAVPVIGSERRQVYDTQPITVVVTEHQAEHKQCPHCGYHNHGKFPDGVEHPVQYGQILKTLMVYFSVFQLIPYERICVLFSDVFGLSISKATIARALKNCNNNLADYEKIVQQALIRAPILHVDETGFRVTAKRQWLHVASTGLLTWYGHHKTRGKGGTDELQILPAFKGTMVHDCWGTYFQYDCHHALCNAHLIRELAGVSENFRQIWSDQMNELIHEIKKVVDSAKLQLPSINQEQIADFEVRYASIIEQGKQENPVTEYIRPVGKRGRKKQSTPKNLLDRFERYQKEILAFMYDFSIPFDNNQAERDIRMMKVQQKISGTFRSEEGADWFCRIRGYISTVRKNGRPILASIKDAFEAKPFIPSGSQKSG
jgi:transposase